MSTFPSANSSVKLKEQEANDIDNVLSNVNMFSNQLHSLMEMLSDFRKHLYNPPENLQSSQLYFPQHVNLEIAKVLRKYNADRLSDVMFGIQKEIGDLLVDVKTLNCEDNFSKYNLVSVLKDLEEGFGKVYYMQKIMEDVQEYDLLRAEAPHE